VNKNEKAAGLLVDIRKKTDTLNGMVEDGRFYKLTLLQRHSMVWSINSSYRKLLSPTLRNELKLLIPAAAVVIAAGCSVTAVPLPDPEIGTDSFKAPVTAALGMTTAVTDYLTYPFLNDHDGDGDLDLVSVTYSTAAGGIPEVVYYENTGTSSSPAFAAPVDATGNFLNIPGEDDMFNGDFGDIDGDGDLDLVTISTTSNYPDPDITKLVYFENGTGGMAAASTELQIIGNGYFISTADLDGDGDLDVIQMPYVSSLSAPSGYKAILNFYENTGTPTAPVFETEVVSSAFGLEIPVDSTVGYPVFTRAVDFDGDGDLDLFIGCYTELAQNPGLYYAENTGTATVANFPSVILNPFDFMPAANSMNGVALGDLDNDGDMDLISGDYYSGMAEDPSFKEAEFYYYENSRF